jgi:hypothetical protein
MPGKGVALSCEPPRDAPILVLSVESDDYLFAAGRSFGRWAQRLTARANWVTR